MKTVKTTYILLCSLFITQVYPDCTFLKHKGALTKEKARLKPLVGKTYSVKTKDYLYNIGICIGVDTAGVPVTDKATVGVFQLDLKKQPDTEAKKGHVIGRISEAEIMMGTEWMLLEYEGGDKYLSTNHCGQEPRRANIMLVCNPSSEGNARLIEENRNKSGDCYYLFEIDHKAMCQQLEPKVYGLSVGSIITILFFVFAGLYLIVGLLYMRFFKRAQGMEQVPNWGFWQDMGNLQADGCSYICRCGRLPDYSSPKQRTYKGVGDDQLDDNEDADDHILPM